MFGAPNNGNVGFRNTRQKDEMSASHTALLGLIAGLTIFLGLPIGRMQSLSRRRRALLSVISAGILLFIFWDVMDAAHKLIATSLASAHASGSWGELVLRSAMLFGGLALGAFGLGFAERWLMKRRPACPIAGGSSLAPASTVTETAAIAEQGERAALTVAMLIAIAIGLHNFSEGLAIGVSARAGEIGLATTLIIGFALHNATEGFGIVGPLDGVHPSWRWLALVGVIGGGPTVLGTLIGYRVSSPPLEIAFYALAAGAVLYVVVQIMGMSIKRLTPQLVLMGLLIGFSVGMASDLIITYAGG
jgi:ZIP family zinc transporter